MEVTRGNWEGWRLGTSLTGTGGKKDIVKTDTEEKVMLFPRDKIARDNVRCAHRLRVGVEEA